jgi:hypothetical protein
MSDFLTSATYQLIWPDSANTVYTIGAANGITHVSLDGTGIPEARRSYEPYLTSDGGNDSGFRLDVRRMVWKVLIQAADEYGLDDARANLFSVFRPIEDPFRLRVTRADGAVRQINCYVDGPIELEEAKGYAYTASIPLIAPDPLWYDPVEKSQTFTSWTNPITVTYGGTWYEFPIIEVTGEVVNLQLQNIASSSLGGRAGQIELNTVPAGEVYTINLRPGQKTITDASGNNVLGTAIDSTSSLSFNLFVEFRLWPTPWKTGGANNISIGGTPGSGGQLKFVWFNRYIGL